jgi:hypothetical protein
VKVNPAGFKKPAYHYITGTDLTDYPEVFKNYQAGAVPPLRPILCDRNLLCHPKGSQGHQSLIPAIRKPFRLLITLRYVSPALPAPYLMQGEKWKQCELW